MPPVRVVIRRVRHKPIIILGAIAFVASGLFPPWVSTFNPPGGGVSETPAGYRLIFDPPSYSGAGARYLGGVRIDYGRLLIQWAMIGAVVAGAISLRRKE